MDTEIYYLNDIRMIHNSKDNFYMVFFEATYIDANSNPYRITRRITSFEELKSFLKEHLVSYSSLPNRIASIVNNIVETYIFTLPSDFNVFIEQFQEIMKEYYNQLDDENKLKIEINENMN